MKKISKTMQKHLITQISQWLSLYTPRIIAILLYIKQGLLTKGRKWVFSMKIPLKKIMKIFKEIKRHVHLISHFKACLKYQENDKYNRITTDEWPHKSTNKTEKKINTDFLRFCNEKFSSLYGFLFISELFLFFFSHKRKKIHSNI